ncbi:MAG: hypothetical protein CM15mP120_24090 [Pseudomonadota bacterium]|nr:MAG: hypothetical protein CM15mP120_24090 [Pseudomonadota bacterium]
MPLQGRSIRPVHCLVTPSHGGWTLNLEHLTPEVYEAISSATQKLIDGLMERAASAGIHICENHVCGMFSLFFGLDHANNYEDVSSSNIERFNRFFHKMLDGGIYLAPSAFEAGLSAPSIPMM